MKAEITIGLGLYCFLYQGNLMSGIFQQPFLTNHLSPILMKSLIEFWLFTNKYDSFDEFYSNNYI